MKKEDEDGREGKVRGGATGKRVRLNLLFLRLQPAVCVVKNLALSLPLLLQLADL